MRYAGIATDHRVEVGGIAGGVVRDKNAEIYLNNSAVPSGFTVLRIPVERLTLTLGDDLAHWLTLALEAQGVSCEGEAIEATYLVEIGTESAGESRFLYLMVADGDDETVKVLIPEDRAISSLGERLYNRIVERGEVVRLKLMRAVNEAFAA